MLDVYALLSALYALKFPISENHVRSKIQQYAHSFLCKLYPRANQFKDSKLVTLVMWVSRCCCLVANIRIFIEGKKVQVGKDQEKAQSEKDSHSKNQGWKKTKLTMRYLYHENIS